MNTEPDDPNGEFIAQNLREALERLRPYLGEVYSQAPIDFLEEQFIKFYKFDALNGGYRLSGNILSDFLSRLLNDDLRTLIDKGFLDYSFDTNLNDFVFTVKDAPKSL